ncbi:hypothetical protein DXG03_009338 [Asterophora parasitica]|uniref:CMP/dCMP-type deaminase domain-containing protein n=1 Tax=Asterophora parasitica TaxID=117018 RepID=A0A9P7GAX2_9AGAR|nr:hypothetical protein DXG03_009338 [Asterophora parasitica]
MSVKAWSISHEDRTKLIQGAFEAKKGSYSPYSKFPVGAALLATDGTLIKGANIENASYGARSANSSNVPSALSPCGLCRQVIREFCSLNMPVLLVPADYPQVLKEGEEQKPGFGEGGVRETTLGELLPDSFGPEHLELPRQ